MTPPKYKRFGLVIFLFLLGTGLAGLCILLIREYHRGNAYVEALREYESGNLPAAKQKFQAIIRNDANQENAYVCLAEIANREGNWREEALCWGYAASLNALETRYRTRQKLALARERNFDALHNLFFSSFSGEEVLSDEDSFYFLLPSESGNRSIIRRNYPALLRKKHPSFFDTEYGRLLRCLESGKNTSAIEKELIALGKSAHPVIAFEALLQAAVIRMDGKAAPEKIEKLLLRAAKINAFAGLFHLENFYIEQLRFDRAVSVCRENFRRFRRPASAIKLAELYVFSGEAEKIRDLLSGFARGDKAVLAAGCYLEALQAFAANRPADIPGSFKQTAGLIKTPLSNLVRLYAAVSNGNAAEMESAWTVFRLMPEFYDLPQRAAVLMSAGIDRLISAGEWDQALRLQSLPGVDPFRNLQQARCLTRRKLQNRTLQENELTEALKRYPQDQVLLQTAVEYFFRRQNYHQSLEWVNRALRLNPPDSSVIHFYRILNLASLGRQEEASELFLEAVKNRPDDAGLIFAACQFAAGRHRTADLQEICRLLRNAESPHLPYAEGELHLLTGNLPAALERLEQVKQGVPEQLFRTAKILGKHDRLTSASALYRMVLERTETSPALRSFTLANLAELHAAEGKPDRSMECAEKAWKLLPDNPAIRLCYVRQLRSAGKTEKILLAVPRIPYGEKPESELRRIWLETAEAEIGRLFHAGKKAEAEQLCRKLLAADPRSSTGKAWQKKLNPEQKK